MDTTTITLSLPTELLQEVEQIARERNISLDTLIAAALEMLIEHDTEYAAAKAEHLSIMAQNFDFGSNGKPTWSRDNLHERRS